MKTLKGVYQILLPLVVIALGVLQYCEYSAREADVCGCYLDDTVFLHREATIFAQATEDKDALRELEIADAYLQRAVAAGRKGDVEVTYRMIHNAKWDLDIATRLMLNHTKPTKASK